MNAVLRTTLPIAGGPPSVAGFLASLGMTVKERAIKAVIPRSAATRDPGLVCRGGVSSPGSCGPVALKMTAARRYAPKPVTFSILIADALNSAVPDLGSMASIVRMFVATSS